MSDQSPLSEPSQVHAYVKIHGVVQTVKCFFAIFNADI